MRRLTGKAVNISVVVLGATVASFAAELKVVIDQPQGVFQAPRSYQRANIRSGTLRLDPELSIHHTPSMLGGCGVVRRYSPSSVCWFAAAPVY